MKPDWSDAPEWANWLAMDAAGDWYWYENEPHNRIATWVEYEGRSKVAFMTCWKETKEKRP